MNDAATPRRRRRALLLAGAGFVVLLACGAFAGATWWRLARQSLPPAAAGATFVVARGESLDQLATRLQARGILEHAWDLTLPARLLGEGGEIKAGEYRIAPGTTPAGLLRVLVAGRILLHRFTIVPGSTFAQVLDRLEKEPALDHTLEGDGPARVMRRLGHPEENPEGRFFPDTYFFARGTSDAELLARAYAAMQQHLQRLWREKASGLPLKTPYQALVLASIVEKETAVPVERARIAGVFVRRLERGMRLDADPTVIYGLGQGFDGNLTRADLAAPTPYNTYRNYGLPPTPICMPGLASLRAALHPASGTALYFVAKGDGTHVFSDTLAEQERMIRKYQLGQSNGGNGDGGAGKIHHP